MLIKDNIRTLRKNEKLTQQEIAKKLEIGLRTYINYENGSVEPNIKILIKLADYFNVSVDYLIGHRQNNKIDISGLNEAQQNIIKMTTELNEINSARVESYISAKIETQNESQNQKKFN